MTEKNETLTYVNDFIADLLNGNIEITYSRAKSLANYVPTKSIFGSDKQTDKRPFLSTLGKVLTNFQLNKNNPQFAEKFANECIQYIIWANAHQIIKRTGIIHKIDDFEKENAQLKEEKEKYQKEIERLNLLNKALHETLDKLGFQRIGKEDTKQGEY